eukprot:1151196-Pelagomonas_calceolata.AAC.6
MCTGFAQPWKLGGYVIPDVDQVWFAARALQRASLFLPESMPLSCKPCGRVGRPVPMKSMLLNFPGICISANMVTWTEGSKTGSSVCRYWSVHGPD